MPGMTWDQWAAASLNVQASMRPRLNAGDDEET